MLLKSWSHGFIMKLGQAVLAWDYLEDECQGHSFYWQALLQCAFCQYIHTQAKFT
jgi:hypothetical protein